MQHLPLIGIVAGLRFDKGNPFYGLRPTYTAAVSAAGGLPVVIVPNIGETALRTLFERLDGVVLSGGSDIDPALYGMANGARALGVQSSDTLRDQAEVQIVRWAHAEDKPLLGICRGAQIMNVALGGTLYRDIAREHPSGTTLDHALWGKFPRDHIAHGVEVRPETRLAEALGAHSLRVNTLHHQALRDIASPLEVTAHAEDGVIEGIEIPAARFFMGVQWHPEELYTVQAPMRSLFDAFIQATRETARS